VEAKTILTEARRRSGLTIRQLGRRAGTSHSAIAAYESGAKTPNTATLQRIVRGCGFDITTQLRAIGPVEDRGQRGRELVEVLDLADQFPNPPAVSHPVPKSMTSLADKVIALHRTLAAAALPHAFGGALALAWCTRQPRGTSDIDLNIFAPTESARLALAALPSEVARSRKDLVRLQRDGQTRLYWDTTPVDIFLNTTDFHEGAMARASLEPFVGEMVPFLACSDVAVFKAFFDRRRDWADIEDMIVAQSIDAEAVATVLVGLLGSEDRRITQLRSIGRELRGDPPDGGRPRTSHSPGNRTRSTRPNRSTEST
jgi:transcriptional regulator with XRE-family HTH domain